MPRSPHDTVDLVVNGARLAKADGSDLSDLERPLRSLALADSPVLLRGEPEDCAHVIERLHELSRRAEHPLRSCTKPEEAADLFSLTSDAGGSASSIMGTWALYGVDEWPTAAQERLARALEALDESRLAGRLRHEHIPRVLVVAAEDNGGSSLPAALATRLSYFKLQLDRTRQ